MSSKRQDGRYFRLASRVGLVLIATLLHLEVAAQTHFQVGDFYPNGSRFPCSAYSVGATDGKTPAPIVGSIEHDLELMEAKRDGIEILGPQYERNSTVIIDAARHRMGATYSVGLPLNFETWQATEDNLSQVYTEIYKQVSLASRSDAIVRWVLVNEELRHWRPVEMRYLEAASRAVRDGDTKRRPLTMYEPGHRDAADLVLTGRHLGAISMGVYTNYSGYAAQRAWVAVAMRRQKQASATLGNLPILFTPEMFENAPPGSPLNVWVAHDILRGLAGGATGISVFSFRRRLGFTDYDNYRSAYSRMLRLLCGRSEISQAFLFGAVGSSALIPSEAAATNVLLKDPQGVSQQASVLAVETRLAGSNSYTVIVNSSPVVVTGQLEGIDTPEVLFSSNGSIDLTTKTVNLSPWGTLVLKGRRN